MTLNGQKSQFILREPFEVTAPCAKFEKWYAVVTKCEPFTGLRYLHEQCLAGLNIGNQFIKL